MKTIIAQHTKWPQFVADDVQHDNIYIMNEFVCICCRNSLGQKNPKMPDQACAKWPTAA